MCRGTRGEQEFPGAWHFAMSNHNWVELMFAVPVAMLLLVVLIRQLPRR